MGQQAYEVAIWSSLQRVARESASWELSYLSVGSMRSRLGPDRRYPASISKYADGWLESVLAGYVYRTRQLVHRLDLRLPAALGPEVVTVHDLAPLRFPDEGDIPRSAARHLRRARFVICPSSFAAAEVRELLGAERTVVIHYGLPGEDDVTAGPAGMTKEELEAFGLGPDYVLHAGGATLRKNLAALAGAWRIVSERRPRLELALCGPPDQRRNDLFDGLPRVRLLGRVEPAGALRRLMASASVVVVPSVYEGFGFPALEAMACGTPVVATKMASLPEVCGDAAWLVDPDQESLADGLRRVLEDQDLRERLREEGPKRAALFRWEEAARRHLSVYEEALVS